MGETWVTAADITAARERFIDAIDGWREPAIHAVALVPADAEISPRDFGLVNVGDSMLPAAVLSTVLGHANGSAVYPVTPAQLDEAIALLEPAEACTEYRHPNLWHWRDELRPAWREDPTRTLFAVFAADDDALTTPAPVRALRVAARTR